MSQRQSQARSDSDEWFDKRYYVTFQERALGTWFLSDDRILDQATAPLTSRILVSDKQPEPQNVSQWKITRTSKCFFFNEKQSEPQNVFQWKATKLQLSLHPIVRAPSKRGTDFFFLQSAQCLLKFAARRKTFQPWTFWKVCEQITQMLKIIRHKGLTIYFWVLLKSRHVDLLKRLLVCNCHRHFKCIHTIPIDFKEIFSQCNLTLWLSTEC